MELALSVLIIVQANTVQLLIPDDVVGQARCWTDGGLSYERPILDEGTKTML